MKNLKVVSNSKPQYSVKQISDKIKTDTWPDKQKYSVKDYLIEETPGVFVPNIEIIIQVRGVLYDISYVKKVMHKNDYDVTYLGCVDIDDDDDDIKDNYDVTYIGNINMNEEDSYNTTYIGYVFNVDDISQ